MITTVTLNPAIDRTLILDTFTPGEVNRISSVYEEMGGKGINVAKVLHALAIDTRAIGMIGKQNIEHTSVLLKQLDFSHEFQEVNWLTRTNMKIIDLEKRQTSDLNEAGFSVKASDLRSFNESLKNDAMKSDYVVLSGSLPKGLSSDTYRNLIQEHTLLSEFVLDCEGDALLEGVKAHPYLIKPNLEELNHAFQKELTTDIEIITFAHTLLETYDIGLILVSLGAKGSLLITDDAAYRASSLKIDVISTVGAGDAMLAGFLTGLSRSFPLDECLRMANVCGALMCAKQDSEMFAYEDVISRMHEIEIEYR